MLGIRAPAPERGVRGAARARQSSKGKAYMPLYESVFIARQDIPAQEVEALAERFAAVIADQGGAVARREYWGLKNMAYRIGKNRKGHYTMFHIDAPPAAVLEMERTMRIDENVLRYMSLRLDELPAEPSIMMQTRAARDDRRRDERRRARRREEERREAARSAAERKPPAAENAAAEAPAQTEPPAPAAAPPPEPEPPAPVAGGEPGPDPAVPAPPAENAVESPETEEKPVP